MSIGFEAMFKGLDELQAALTRGEAQTALAAQSLVQQSSLLLIREAQKNFAGSHSKGRPHIPNPYNYPNVVTGTLRRSIRSDGIRPLGPAIFSTRVGPTTVYGRAIELGRPGHNSPYPYFGPGVKRVRTTIGATMVSTWSGALRF